jgi:hypothetical protein
MLWYTTQLNNIYYISAHRHTFILSLPTIDNPDASHRFEGAVSSPTSGKHRATLLCMSLCTGMHCLQHLRMRCKASCNLQSLSYSAISIAKGTYLVSHKEWKLYISANSYF